MLWVAENDPRCYALREMGFEGSKPAPKNLYRKFYGGSGKTLQSSLLTSKASAKLERALHCRASLTMPIFNS